MAQLLVIFRVGTTRYGIGIDAVEEILLDLPITRLPRAPRGVIGVVDARGRVVPVFDLHARFGAGRRVESNESRLVLVRLASGMVALPVDEVDEVASIEPSSVQRVGAPGCAPEMDYLAGVVHHREQLVLWIEPERLIPAAVQKIRRLPQAA
ncbi:MAG: purine-binding chemotaxis protein CheW [Dehalococcoidia bacterium]|nr:chemotaxis protein CheW [Dehalococcoidia bacterium]MCL4230242.1 chemotaxis protein CheW [Dehalococcoidia bacterium]NUQ56038.1 purine-binding chemotaxis protein CheW [Dehalococcoidia bacterium]